MAVAPHGDHSLTPVAQGAECLDLALLLFVEDEGYGLYSLINFAVGDPGVAARPNVLRAAPTVTSNTATRRNAAFSASAPGGNTTVLPKLVWRAALVPHPRQLGPRICQLLAFTGCPGAVPLKPPARFR